MEAEKYISVIAKLPDGRSVSKSFNGTDTWGNGRTALAEEFGVTDSHGAWVTLRGLVRGHYLQAEDTFEDIHTTSGLGSDQPLTIHCLIPLPIDDEEEPSATAEPTHTQGENTGDGGTTDSNVEGDTSRSGTTDNSLNNFVNAITRQFAQAMNGSVSNSSSGGGPTEFSTNGVRIGVPQIITIHSGEDGRAMVQRVQAAGVGALSGGRIIRSSGDGNDEGDDFTNAIFNTLNAMEMNETHGNNNDNEQESTRPNTTTNNNIENDSRTRAPPLRSETNRRILTPIAEQIVERNVRDGPDVTDSSANRESTAEQSIRSPRQSRSSRANISGSAGSPRSRSEMREHIRQMANVSSASGIVVPRESVTGARGSIPRNRRSSSGVRAQTLQQNLANNVRGYVNRTNRMVHIRSPVRSSTHTAVPTASVTYRLVSREPSSFVRIGGTPRQSQIDGGAPSRGVALIRSEVSDEGYQTLTDDYRSIRDEWLSNTQLIAHVADEMLRESRNRIELIRASDNAIGETAEEVTNNRSSISTVQTPSQIVEEHHSIHEQASNETMRHHQRVLQRQTTAVGSTGNPVSTTTVIGTGNQSELIGGYRQGVALAGRNGSIRTTTNTTGPYTQASRGDNASGGSNVAEQGSSERFSHDNDNIFKELDSLWNTLEVASRHVPYLLVPSAADRIDSRQRSGNQEDSEQEIYFKELLLAQGLVNQAITCFLGRLGRYRSSNTRTTENERHFIETAMLMSTIQAKLCAVNGRASILFSDLLLNDSSKSTEEESPLPSAPSVD